MYYGQSREFGFLPPGVNGDVQIFTAPNNAITQWQQWVKPAGVTMVYMICIAGGGGGGGGFTRATTVAGGGGGGGACSGVVSSLMPAVFLPNVLKVSVGLGGLGSTGTGVAGGNGTNSYIASGVGLTAGSTIPNIILESGANAPGGGGAGTTAAAGAAGAVPTISTVARNGSGAIFGIQKFTVGIVGLAGGVQTGAAGAAATAVWNAIPLSAGTGGAGVNGAGTGFAGGALTIQAAMDLPDGAISPAAILAGGVAGSGAAVGGPGNNGLQYWKPLLGTGGTGGGSADGQPGGQGGDGAIGCGGGGGGAGTTGGKGGSGGNGLVVIISW
jgi:hypothetical protein